MTQEELADRMAMHMDISVASISRVENGKQPYNQQMLEIMADVLDTDPGSLIALSPGSDRPIADIWNRADPAQKHQIVAMAEAIIKYQPPLDIVRQRLKGEEDEVSKLP